MHLYGNRPGDHAPRALLELVDNDKGDLRLELTARCMARQVFMEGKKRSSSSSSASMTAITPLTCPNPEKDSRFLPQTRTRIAQLLRFPDGRDARMESLLSRANEHLFRLRAEDQLDGGAVVVDEERMATGEWKDMQPRGRLLTPPVKGRRLMAGMAPSLSMPGAPAAGETTSRATGGKAQQQRSRFFEPQPLKGTTQNSVIRLGKGAFARRGGVDRVAGNPVAFRSAARKGEAKTRGSGNARVRYS